MWKLRAPVGVHKKTCLWCQKSSLFQYLVSIVEHETSLSQVEVARATFHCSAGSLWKAFKAALFPAQYFVMGYYMVLGLSPAAQNVGYYMVLDVSVACQVSHCHGSATGLSPIVWAIYQSWLWGLLLVLLWCTWPVTSPSPQLGERAPIQKR